MSFLNNPNYMLQGLGNSAVITDESIVRNQIDAGVRKAWLKQPINTTMPVRKPAATLIRPVSVTHQSVISPEQKALREKMAKDLALINQGRKVAEVQIKLLQDQLKDAQQELAAAKKTIGTNAAETKQMQAQVNGVKAELAQSKEEAAAMAKEAKAAGERAKLAEQGKAETEDELRALQEKSASNKKLMIGGGLAAAGVLAMTMMGGGG